MYVYDSINTVYVRLCTLMTTVMSFTLLDSHKPNSGLDGAALMWCHFGIAQSLIELCVHFCFLSIQFPTNLPKSTIVHRVSVKWIYVIASCSAWWCFLLAFVWNIFLIFSVKFSAHMYVYVVFYIWQLRNCVERHCLCLCRSVVTYTNAKRSFEVFFK